MTNPSARSSVFVHDPFGVTADARMPALARALDPAEAQVRLAQCWAAARGEETCLELRTIQVGRYKPGRRCLIEYGVEIRAAREPPGTGRTATLVGKARAKGADKTTCQLVHALRQDGFNDSSADGISVPEPIGTIPEFQQWLQVKAPGVEATEALLKPAGTELAGRIAEAAHKLHQTNSPTARRHTIADELRILEDRLGQTARIRSEWVRRLERLLEACHRLAARLPEPAWCGIHRDFYPAHVLVDDTRLWLVDFDLYCLGDPALDAGNFLGHLIELSLRHFGDPQALAEREQALEERFVELAGSSVRPAVRAYTTLTLVRHIYLSTQFPERMAFAEPLLELCEQRLGKYLRSRSCPGGTNDNSPTF
jgi:hypothetical protein